MKGSFHVFAVQERRDEPTLELKTMNKTAKRLRLSCHPIFESGREPSTRAIVPCKHVSLHRVAVNKKFLSAVYAAEYNDSKVTTFENAIQTVDTVREFACLREGTQRKSLFWQFRKGNWTY